MPDTCQHSKTISLYAQRRRGSNKRAFEVEAHKCLTCGAVVPSKPEAGETANGAIGEGKGYSHWRL